MELLKAGDHQPVTLFLPSDQAVDALPPEQKNFLFHSENRPQLLEYLKFHILPGQKVPAAGSGAFGSRPGGSRLLGFSDLC